jgi:hypothetical protein
LGLYKLKDDDDDSSGKPLKEFAYAITFPDGLAQQVEQVDTKGALAFQQLMKRALPETQAK